MPALVLIDEDLHRSLASVFKELGFIAFDARDVGLRSQEDIKIFEWAQKESAILVTGDLGFSSMAESHKHHGVIILRFPNEMSTHAINSEVKRLLSGIAKTAYRKNLIVVRPGKVRVRKPSLGL